MAKAESRYSEVTPILLHEMAEQRNRDTRFDNAPQDRTMRFGTLYDSAVDTNQRLAAQPSGMTYAITRKALKEGFENNIENVPMPECPYLLLWDELTDNYLVCRLPDECDQKTADYEIAKFQSFFGHHLPGVIRVNLGATP